MLNTVLNSVLRSGVTSILGGARSSVRGAGSGGGLGGMAGQAALTAALGMLLRRGGGGRLLKVGGAAALGMMAYKAWQDYQARQGSTTTPVALRQSGSPHRMQPNRPMPTSRRCWWR